MPNITHIFYEIYMKFPFRQMIYMSSIADPGLNRQFFYNLILICFHDISQIRYIVIKVNTTIEHLM